MADAGSPTPAEHHHESNHLTYGHFGTATYDTGAHKWRFLRNDDRNQGPTGDDKLFTASAPFKLIKKSRHVWSESKTQGSNTRTLQPDAGLSQTLQLIRKFPELIAATDAIQSNYLSSSICDRRAMIGLSHLSNCGLEFGAAVILGDNDRQSGHDTVPISARICGRASTQVEFACLGRGQAMYESVDGTKIEIDIPTFGNRDTVQWTTLGKVVGIYVTDKESEQKDTWFAVSSTMQTDLFIPRLHTTGPAAVLDENQIIAIPCSRTGGSLHAHVAFHPHQAGMFAIVDVSGNWSIWKVRGKHSMSVRRQYNAELISSNAIPIDEEIKRRSTYPCGWHKVCWLSRNDHVIDRLLVCNRRSAFLFDLQGHLRGCVDLRMRKTTSDALRDVHVRDGSVSECFFLTGSRILWMTCDTQQHMRSIISEPLSLIVSWNHFRNHNDESLALHLLQHYTDQYVILSSAMTSSMTVWSASPAASEWPSISDPILFDFPFRPQDTRHALYFRRTESVSSSRRTDKQQPAVFKIFIQGLEERSWILQEITYQILDYQQRQGDIKFKLFNAVSLPSSRLRYHRSARVVNGDDTIGFVVNDSPVVGASGQLARSDSQLPRFREARSRYMDLNIKDFTLIYTSWLEHEILPQSGSQSGLPIILDRTMAEWLESPETKGLYKLMFDILPNTQSTEIEDESERLVTWLKASSLDNSNLPEQPTRRLQASAILNSDSSLIEIYHDLIDEWVSPLPAEIPQRTRLFRERLARQVAMDLYTSQIVVSRKPLLRVDSSASMNADTQQTAQLDSLPSSPPIAYPMSSSVLPSSSQTYPESQTSISEHKSHLNSISRSILSSYTTFGSTISPSQPIPVTAKASSVTDSILAHLPTSITIDPSTYSYKATNQRLFQTYASADLSSMDSRTRRRREREIRHQHKKLSQQQQIQRSTFHDLTSVPTVLDSSQFLPSSQTPHDSTSSVPTSMPVRSRGLPSNSQPTPILHPRSSRLAQSGGQIAPPHHHSRFTPQPQRHGADLHVATSPSTPTTTVTTTPRRPATAMEMGIISASQPVPGPYGTNSAVLKNNHARNKVKGKKSRMQGF